MAALCLLLTLLIIQGSLSYAETNVEQNNISSDETYTDIDKIDDNDADTKEFRAAPSDWMGMFLESNSNFYPGSSATLMNQVTNTDKSPEEQLQDIKDIANKISLAIQSEMANLLSYAMNACDKETEDNSLRKKRSYDNPIDSTTLVMRLLKHIQSNNEYQNIAIEKMMSAQEIADKFGINFEPDTEILSDLALAANEQSKELASILTEACDIQNVTTKTDNITSHINQYACDLTPAENVTDKCPEVNMTQQIVTPSYEHDFSHEHQVPHSHHQEPFSSYNYYYNYPYETQIMAPTQQHHYSPSVTPKPSFYDSISYNPVLDYPYCSVEPFGATTLLMPEEFIEPQLTGEEYEETVSSKVFIDHDEEPGASTVNHVMTYTVTEKAHFRTPQIEKLPQQMQYYFYLV